MTKGVWDREKVLKREKHGDKSQDTTYKWGLSYKENCQRNTTLNTQVPVR